MVVDALGALDLSNVDHVVVGLLKEHVDKYCGGNVQAILSAFEDGVSPSSRDQGLHCHYRQRNRGPSRNDRAHSHCGEGPRAHIF